MFFYVFLCFYHCDGLGDLPHKKFEMKRPWMNPARDYSIIHYKHCAAKNCFEPIAYECRSPRGNTWIVGRKCAYHARQWAMRVNPEIIRDLPSFKKTLVNRGMVEEIL